MVRETVKAYTTRLPAPGGLTTTLIISILSISISISILSIGIFSIFSIIRWVAQDSKARCQTRRAGR